MTPSRAKFARAICSSNNNKKKNFAGRKHKDASGFPTIVLTYFRGKQAKTTTMKASPVSTAYTIQIPNFLYNIWDSWCENSNKMRCTPRADLNTSGTNEINTRATPTVCVRDSRESSSSLPVLCTVQRTFNQIYLNTSLPLCYTNRVYHIEVMLTIPLLTVSIGVYNRRVYCICIVRKPHQQKTGELSS